MISKFDPENADIPWNMSQSLSYETRGDPWNPIFMISRDTKSLTYHEITLLKIRIDKSKLKGDTHI